jgi:hypothetical protein
LAQGIGMVSNYVRMNLDQVVVTSMFLQINKPTKKENKLKAWKLFGRLII